MEAGGERANGIKRVSECEGKSLRVKVETGSRGNGTERVSM